MDYIMQLINRYPKLSICKKEIQQSYILLQKSYRNNGKLLVAGNGGSAADSNHIVGELMKSFIKKRSPKIDFLNSISKIDTDTGVYLAEKLQGSLPAISLCTNTALITASLNDVDGNILFAQQVYGYGIKDDVFMGISTSGNSKNIVYAMAVAKAKGLKTIALTGNTGGKIATMADSAIIVPATETYKIQELHLPIYHALCLQLEEYFF